MIRRKLILGIGDQGCLGGAHGEHQRHESRVAIRMCRCTRVPFYVEFLVWVVLVEQLGEHVHIRGTDMAHVGTGMHRDACRAGIEHPARRIRKARNPTSARVS